MIDTTKELLRSQLEAALSTLNACLVRCPDNAWEMPIANLAFDQVVFHTLFFTDYYLGRDAESVRDQPFHRAHAAYFRDYEELEPRAQVNHYDRRTTLAYLAHCREKGAAMIAAETRETLEGPAGFARRTFSRAELYAYTTRHVQHHAAQLGLRLRADHGVDLPWFGAGWTDA